MNFVLVCDSGRISPASFTNAAIAPSAAQPLTASITRCAIQEEGVKIKVSTQGLRVTILPLLSFSQAHFHTRSKNVK
eukprot:m.36368 g.36368  ORF g.36368 m.36368 type:complete len:77 (-) comp14477_c0_seq1:264-494(-)